MPLPWLVLIDTLIDVTNLVVTRKRRSKDEPEPSAAIAKRVELEREQAQREQLRAERLLKLETLRQAGDREIARLRLMAGLAVGSWIGSLFLSARLVGGPIGARIMLGGGWLLLLVALLMSFAAQARVGRALAKIDQASAQHDDLTAGSSGAVIPGLIVIGLALIGFALLLP